ncbi:MAG: transposase [Thermomicrobiales bacterium]|nr:transposase [Thermomicrobiales bacterium]MCO5223894.1 transposase [Thermomicrobiales bacterium]
MNRPSRKNSLRYPGYDYSQPGGVFVTLVAHERQELFAIEDESRIILTSAGRALEDRWLGITTRFPDVLTDDFVVMPDHVHGILWMGAADSVSPTSVSDVIRWLKSAVVEDYRVGVRDSGWPPYVKHLWQRGFHDHIIRGERDLVEIRKYIDANPYRRKPS